MANDWKIKKDGIGGPDSGKELEGSLIRVNQDDNGQTFYEFLAVVARTEAVKQDDKLHFPAFAYNGLVWHISVDPPYAPGQEHISGGWHNNKHKPDAAEDEDGTYTAQSGSGVPEEERGKKDDEERGKKDAASASA